MNSKTLFVQVLTLLVALQCAEANGFKRINAMIHWTKLSQGVCWLMFNPSLLCTQIPQITELDQQAKSKFVEGEESSLDQATDPIEQPVWLGLRH